MFSLRLSELWFLLFSYVFSSTKRVTFSVSSWVSTEIRIEEAARYLKIHLEPTRGLTMELTKVGRQCCQYIDKKNMGGKESEQKRDPKAHHGLQ